MIYGESKKLALGRGLSALLGESEPHEGNTSENGVSHLATLDIKPGKFQPRHHFDDEKMTFLVDSIREKGIIQPLVVRALPEKPGTYEIIAGERRWRAARMLNLETVPAIIRECSDREALELALIENIQRDDLTPIEEAQGYQRLLEEFNYTQEELAQAIGKSRSHVANMLRLNQLPDSVKEMVQSGKISAGHARTLVNADDVVSLAQSIIENNLNVREAEHLKRQTKFDLPETEAAQQAKIIENEIARLLKLPVAFKVKKSGATLSLQFNSYEEIDDFMDKLRVMNAQKELG